MKQQKKILFLSRLYHPHIGGVEKHVEEISTELLRKGHSVTVITEKFDDQMPSREKIKGVEVVRIKIGGSNFLKKIYIWKWIAFNSSLFKNADIIHIHDVFFWIVPLIPFLLDKKVFMTFHGYEGYPIKKRWIFERKVAEMCTKGNICVGEFMKKWYKTHPTSVIYGGVRLKYQNKMPNSQSAVFFGRLDSQTGFLEYLKAYALIKKKFPKFHLTVVGEGEFIDKIPAGVTVHGFKKDITTYIYENKFIFVSRYLSMLEALASNREVVATYDNPVKRDYLKQSPFARYVLVAKNEKETAEYVLTQLKKNKPVENEGFSWAKNQTWRKIANVYEKLWGI